MLRSLLLLLLLLVSLHAQSDSELLKRASKLAASSTKSEQFRAYNDYKSIYLRALVNNDETIKLKALKGIVKSGKKLHIDVDDYEKELRNYNKKSSKSSYKKVTPSRKNLIKKSSTKKKKSNKKLYVKASSKLKSVRWRDGRLVLTFDKKLKNKQINYFTMYDKKKKRYKYVFDIHASMLTRSQRLRKRGVEKIKLAQYNQNTLRLVFQNPKKLNVRFQIKGNELIIRLDQKSTKKAAISSSHREKAPTRLDRNKVVVIDPGHGGKDPGAIGYGGLQEKRVVLSIAKELRNILRARGYKVYMTRDRDIFIKLRNRTKYANRKKADLFISIHANAVGKKDAKKVQGLESYFLSKSRSSRAKKVAEMENSADLDDLNFYGRESFLNTLNYHNIIAANKLAIDLQRGALGELKKSYSNVCDAGVREGPFWVLVGAQMPAVLVEVGFITHPKEAKRLRSKKYQKKLAKGLANGVERYFLNN